MPSSFFSHLRYKKHLQTYAPAGFFFVACSKKTLQKQLPTVFFRACISGVSLAKDRNIPCVVKGGAKRKHGGFSF